MNILITSFYYYPELTPRAFRTHELVKEFCAQGHHVTLYLPNKAVFKHADLQIPNLVIRMVGDPDEAPRQENAEPKALAEKNKPKRQIIYQFLKKMIPRPVKNKIKEFREWKASYFYPIHRKDYIRQLAEELKCEKSYDLLISIGLPIEVHLGTAIGLLKNKQLRKTKVKVADYGDPFSTNGKVFAGYRLVDFFIARMFDYFTVPTEIAVPAYRLFKRKNHIKVIPQAFKLNEYKTAEYTPNSKPTFAYAGCFYQKIRNPAFFFDYLKQLNKNFQFYLFTIKESRDTQAIIDKHKQDLGDKLHVVYNTERKKLIYELSKMDFLINFDNNTSNQLPSKLIDYRIAGRPICSISPSKHRQDFHTFNNFFLNGDYSNSIKINLNAFDISVVASKFLLLE